MSLKKRLLYLATITMLLGVATGCEETNSQVAMAKPIPVEENKQPQDKPEEENKQEATQPETTENDGEKEPEQTQEETPAPPSPDIKLAGEATVEPSTTAPQQPTVTSSAVGYNDSKSWWFKRNSDHTPPTAQQDININQYGGYYLGDTSQKVIYLTFDEGYENGFTPMILDVLKANDVKAAFFVTKAYIDSEPELIKRMVAEGHIVGNHSVTHPNMPEKTDEEIAQELQGCAEAFKNLTGQDMPMYFRPPAGVYSVRSLEKTFEQGYKSIFWSFAYKDWDTKNQPTTQEAYDMVMNNYHNGSIMLLHAVSEANTNALDSIIKSLKERGYTFVSLDELP